MQKFLSLLATLILVISLTGCSETPDSQAERATNTTPSHSPSLTTAEITNAPTTLTTTIAGNTNTTKTKKPATTTKTTDKTLEPESEPTQPEKITRAFKFDTSFPSVKTKTAVYEDPQNGNTLPYRLYFPKDYDPKKKYPLLLALHGAGEIGTDNKSQLNNFKNLFACNGDLLAQGFVLLPQSNTWWNLDYSKDGDEGGTLGSALHLLEEIQNTYSIYKNRIYVTGLSMGGYATWDLLQDYGHLFAAGIPVCGGGDTAKAAALKNIPIKIYHSLDDDTVGFNASQRMYDAITAAGGKKVEFIQLDGIGHAAWEYAYSDREAISWLYSQEIAKNDSGQYTYQPYFKVCDGHGKVILTEEDIENLYYTISYEGDTMHYTMELLLSDAGRKKLDKAYAKKSTYTAYWLNQKMFTYTASSTTINNLFMIPDVFNEENVFGFHDTLTIVCNMRRRLVWKNTCFSRK